MTNRTLLAALTAGALLATACGDADGTDATATAPTEAASAAPSDTSADVDLPAPDVDGEGGEGDDDEFEGEPRREDALYGVEVCEAMIDVVLGDRAAGEPWALSFVLDLLAPAPGFEPAPEDITAWEGDQDRDYPTCNVSAGGDAWWQLALVGDGHVGHQAVGAILRSSYESDEDIELAIEDAGLAGEVCDGADPQGHELVDLTGTHIVLVLCESYAYQASWQPMFWSGFDLRAMPVEQWFDGQVTDEAFILGFPDAGNGGGLENLEKGRGPGDCGTFSVWSVGDDLSLDLAYATHRACEDSDGTADPAQWEQVHPAEG